MLPTLPDDAGAAASFWERGRGTFPLAYAALWHCDEPRTSQRIPLVDPGEDVTLAAGGNGAGKTELGAQLSAAVALGRSDPGVRVWMQTNSVRRDLIPPDGGTVLAISLNASMSIHVQREAIRKYLPPETQWRNPGGPGISVAWLPNGHKIVFLTNDSGARAVAGYSAACVWIDEEPDEAVYNEALQRVSRYRWEGRSGYLFVTMTPLKGLGSWVYKRFVEAPDQGTRVHYIHGGDNPFIDQAKRARILRSYGTHERTARDRGEFTSVEGLVYDFDPRVHVIPSFKIPPEWVRYGAIDWGTRNPFCYLLAAHDPSDDTLHFYRAIYRRERTITQHVEAIREITDVWPEWIVADSEDRGSRLTMAREHDIPTLATRKGKGSVRSGLNHVQERLEPDANGRPHLFIHDHPSMRPVIKEFLSYRWDTMNSKRDQPDMPLKKDDHAMDAVRYLCTRFAASGTFGAG